MSALVGSIVRVRGRFAGPGYLAGTSPYGLVTVNAVPAARWVEVRHRATRRVVATQFSADDGTYRFDGLDPAQEFDVICRDWQGVYEDVMVSRVKPWPYDGSGVVPDNGDNYTPPRGDQVALALDVYVEQSHIPVPISVWTA